MDQNPDQTQATPKQQLVERVRAATNVLVTVRSNPSVDELAAAIGLTLMLNKLGKHATAVFSGEIPSTLEFLKPQDTLEQNTDSLRDFIVSLDKSKADKLRYKVEENVVKIFITPYRTSITQDDLEFTQGDFNVDVVLALGVTGQGELDQAITAHGRILHDATVVTVTAGQHESTLGSINWQEAGASSLSEMLVSISEAFQGGIIDEQMATAFLTGIVAETERFSNAKTTPKVMTMSAQLMAAGANQQLIANELQKVEEMQADQPVDLPHDSIEPEAVASDDGSLTINHKQDIEVVPEQQDMPSGQVSDELPEIQQAPEQPQSSPERPTELQPPAHQEPSLEASGNLEDNEEVFVPPLLPSESGESYEPLLKDKLVSQQEQPNVIEPNALVDIFAPLQEANHPPADGDGQINIDDHGNMVRSDRAPQPHHKVIEPLPQESHQPLPDLNDQLANLSKLLQQPDIHADISDVKGTDAGQMLEASSMPALDLPSLPSIEAPQEAPAQQSFVPAPQQQTTLPPEPVLEPATEPEVPDETTLLDIERSVQSPHLTLTEEPAQDEAAVVNSARNAVQDAISQAGYDANRPEPRNDLGAQPLGLPAVPAQSFQPPVPDVTAPQQPVLNGFDPSLLPGESNNQEGTLPPPPVPPPMMPM